MQNINNFCPIAPKHFSSPVLENFKKRTTDSTIYKNTCTNNGGYLVSGMRANSSDTGITTVYACVRTDDTNYNRLTSIYSDVRNNKRSVCTSLNNGSCTNGTNYNAATIRKGEDTFWMLFSNTSNHPFNINGSPKIDCSNFYSQCDNNNYAIRGDGSSTYPDRTKCYNEDGGNINATGCATGCTPDGGSGEYRCK